MFVVDKCDGSTLCGIMLALGVVSYPIIMSSLCLFRVMVRMMLPIPLSVVAVALYSVFALSIVFTLGDILIQALKGVEGARPKPG